MHENIFAILAADEAKSLCVVKPLHCSLFHFVVPVSEFLLRDRMLLRVGNANRRRDQLKIASFKLS
jgi:hypothetical protein